MSEYSKPGKVTAIGEILVEMMSRDQGVGFLEPQTIVGPFPSGAPAIFIDQVAKLGQSASIIGAVGDDDFGQVNLRRLTADGVDVSGVAICSDKATGIAFVRYRPDGARDFLFTIADSAASHIPAQDIESRLANTDHLHVVGSSLTMPTVADCVEQAVAIIKAAGGTISFDPNVRPEIMRDPRMKSLLQRLLLQSDLVLPSEGELAHLCEADNDLSAITELLRQGVPEIVLKRGRHGASHHSQNGFRQHTGFQVVEVDPTGAGDTFGATYIACRRLGHTIEQAVAHACAAGAMAVMAHGPMEGSSTLAAIAHFMKTTPVR